MYPSVDRSVLSVLLGFCGGPLELASQFLPVNEVWSHPKSSLIKSHGKKKGSSIFAEKGVDCVHGWQEQPAPV